MEMASPGVEYLARWFPEEPERPVPGIAELEPYEGTQYGGHREEGLSAALDASRLGKVSAAADWGRWRERAMNAATAAAISGRSASDTLWVKARPRD